MANFKNIANTKVRKTQVLPTILLGLLVTVIITVFGGIQIALMLVMLCEDQNQKYSTAAELTAAIINEKITETGLVVEHYSDIIGDRKIDRGLCKEFGEFAKFNGFTDAYIVDTDGNGYDGSGYSVSLKSTVFFKYADTGRTVVERDNTRGDELIFITPKYDGQKCDGYVIAKFPVVLDISDVVSKSWPNVSEIYILDEKNKVIAYNQEGTIDFDYNQLEVSPTDVIYQDYTGNIFQIVTQKGFHNETIGMLKFSDTDEDFDDIYDSDELITPYNVWFSKPLGINNWKVMMKTSQKISPNIEVIVEIAGISLAVLLTFQLIYFIIVVCGQIHSNRKLVKLLFLDPITGGTNWLRFKSDAPRILKRRKKMKYVVVVFDVAKFKMYNDMYGHEQGNNLLIAISNTISKFVKKRFELATRYSVDQFVLLLAYSDKEQLTVRINGLVASLQNLSTRGKLSYRFGVYEFEGSEVTVERALNLAGMAKDSAEFMQESTVRYFDNDMHLKLIKEKEIENTMEDALQKKEFVVYLQPKYSTSGETLSGAEALVRWASETKGFISPGEFIPTFEKNGFITKLDDYMLDAVCGIQSRWIADGKQPVPISVNISRVHFEDPNLAEHIKFIVDKYNVPYKYIELELTESAFFDDKLRLVDTVKKLREYGFVVSMDDFGSGFSSLNSLKDLPLDVVKLDGEFFRSSENDERSRCIIRDTIGLAKNLHMKTVAEGIETREQVDFLQNLGCDLIQGYYFARPMPVEEFERQNGYSEKPAEAVKEKEAKEAMKSASEEKASEKTDAPVAEEKAPEKTEAPEAEEKAPEKTEAPEAEEKAPEKTEAPETEEKAPEKTEAPVAEEKALEKTEAPVAEEKNPENKGVAPEVKPEIEPAVK